MAATIEIENPGATWRVRWTPASMDRDPHARAEFGRRLDACAGPDPFDVFHKHEDQLDRRAEISGGRLSGTALYLTEDAAKEMAGVIRALFAAALVQPFDPFEFRSLRPVADASAGD